MSVLPALSPANEALLKLAALVQERAEIFAAPSTSRETAEDINRSALQATKRLFDESLQEEPTSLKALAALLADIRGSTGSANGRGIKTRSKAAASASETSGKGKGRITNGIRDKPIFKPTPLSELYLGEDGASVEDAELSQRMIWEQLEMRTSKVLDLYKEIVRDGDSSGDEDENGEAEMEDGFDEGDSDEELIDGEELDEDDEDMDPELYEGGDSDEMEEDLLEEGFDDEEDEGEYTPPERSEPYFAPLRDGAASDEGDDLQEDEDEEEDSDSEVPAHRRTEGSKKGKTSSQPASVKGKSPVDRGFFSLSDFNAQTNEAEEQMNRYMRMGKSKSANDISLNGLEDDDEEDEEIDYFAPADDLDDEDEDGEDGAEEDEEDGMRPEDMRYDDFWKPPKLLYGDSPKQVAKGKERTHQKMTNGSHDQKAKGKGNKASKSAQAEEPASDADIPVPSSKADTKKRRVSFHEAVKVQEFETDNPGKQSAIAALVKKFGMKEAMKRIASGEINEEDLQDDDVEEGDEDDDLMLSDMLDQDLEDGDEDEGDEEDEDMDEDDDESAVSDESGDQDSRAMRRISRDLFADEEEDADLDLDHADSKALTPAQKKKSQQSRYEARMAALSEQIAELEAENVGEREWTLKGEAKSRDRPINSLLEEDLEFDQVAKVVPVVTEESSLSLEDKIKKRILDDQFDDVVRRRKHEPTAYLPSRLLDIKDTQSERSLAEIYADEFSAERARANGEAGPVPDIDAKLQKEHDSISSIFDEVCSKLDALSNARFTPKAAQTQITTISNLPSISMESALPTAASSSTLLAPEEVYAPAQRGTLTSKAELTPSQKKAARQKARKEKQVTMESIKKYGGQTGNTKKAKERAMNSLIGKRGVTVIGKGKAAKSALTGKDRKGKAGGARAEAGESGHISANAFKL